MINATNGFIEPKKRFEAITKNNHPLDEVISALQKEIRRGKTEEAFYWALELFESNFQRYLWKRLKVIANEDIGIANPQAIILIDTLAREFDDFLKDERHGSARLCLANAILYLTQSKKTRAADDLQGVVRLRRDLKNWRLTIPDYALDKHTKRGRILKRSWKHWIEEGCQLENHDININVWADEANDLRQKEPKQNELF